MSLQNNRITPLGVIQEAENLTNERIAEETRKLNEENSAKDNEIKVENRKLGRKKK